MNAIPKLQPIRQTVLRRPLYESTAETLDSFESWIEANLTSVTVWFEQLRAIEPEEFCDLAEFAHCQYEVELAARKAVEDEIEARHCANTWQDRDAEDAGVRMYGEI